MTLPKAKQRAKDFRKFRVALGLTQDELAEALGYSEGTVRPGGVVSRKENGARPVHEYDLLALECLLRRARKWPVR